MTSLRTFVLQRLALIPITVYFMVTVIFIILRVLPGTNPIRAINPRLPLAQVEAISENLGLNKPIFEQYLDYLGKIINLDFGRSFNSNTIILEELLPRFAATIELTLVAILIGIPLGIFLGTYAGRWRETRRDHLLRIYSIAVFAIPIFLFGIYLQVIFGVLIRHEGAGWIAPNLRTSGGVSAAINETTGIYFIDALFFSGPGGWEVILLIIGIMLFITGLAVWVNKNRKNNEKSWIEPRNLTLAFLIYTIIVLFFINESTVLATLNLPLPGLIYLIIQVTLFFTGILMWPLSLTGLSKDSKSKIKRAWKYGLFIILLPSVFYFWDSFYVPAFRVTSSIEPVTGYRLFIDVFEHLLLPGLALGLLLSGVISRVVRTNMIVAMNEAYVDASRARGIRENRIVYNYALKNATIPAVPLFGLQFALLLAGAILTETTFSYQGLGLYLFTAINSTDFPQIQGAIIFLSFSVAIVSFFTDLLYASLDSRVRL
ncbi:MAG: ABC transporter permease [Candidatus Hodarchaeales archaeon]|jgi:ABC-type dipeptide/oligopeptide/nickel transport system permease component